MITILLLMGDLFTIVFIFSEIKINEEMECSRAFRSSAKTLILVHYV